MNCYVTNSKSCATYPPELNKENTLFYPEARMTTMDCLLSTCPKDFHIVTDSPFLVSLYSREDVFIWRDGKWENPKIQTFGTSFFVILDDIFGYDSSIPQAVIDSKKCTNCMGFGRK